MTSTPPKLPTIKKLSSLVNKEIVKRHLDESIRHQQSRNKYRSHKLMNNFIIPTGASSDKLFLWSNAYGNGFNLVEKEFQRWIGTHQSKLIVQDMKTQINQSIYKLWADHRQVSTSNPFHKSHTLIATISVILIGLLLLSFLLISELASFMPRGALAMMEDIFPQLLIYTFIGMWVLGMVVSLVAYNRQYQEFNYDREVVKVIVEVLGRYQESLLQEGWFIKLDKEITCICLIRNNQKDTNDDQINTNIDPVAENQSHTTRQPNLQQNKTKHTQNIQQPIPNIFRSFAQDQEQG